jgi:hypothetical protein
MSQSSIKLKRNAKGERPVFFADPDVDKLLAMLMGLAGEVSVMRDRLDTVERLAEAKGVFSTKDIDDYQPSDAVHAERAERREILLSEITRIVQAEIEGIDDAQEMPYDAAVELVEKDT